MSPHGWVREFDHPYRQNKNCATTHGNMVKRLLPVPPYSAIAVPFNWMLRRRQKAIDAKLLQPLPADATPPFATPWVFGSQRQEAIIDLAFGRLTDGKSLVLFYTKEDHPLGDGLRRLVVGIGCITKVGKREHYDTVDHKKGYPLWDRVISHSIRPDGEEGFLLPYHEYMTPTGNQKEDDLRAEQLREIIVTPPPPSPITRIFPTALKSPTPMSPSRFLAGHWPPSVKSVTTGSPRDLGKSARSG